MPPLATPTGNFGFLREDFPSLYTLGKEAEFLLYPDPAAVRLERLHAEPAAPAKGKRGAKPKWLPTLYYLSSVFYRPNNFFLYPVR